MKGEELGSCGGLPTPTLEPRVRTLLVPEKAYLSSSSPT